MSMVIKGPLSDVQLQYVLFSLGGLSSFMAKVSRVLMIFSINIVVVLH